ncbi:hypothetical protein LTR95_010247 [Oleoguttula sp. CCFEE 5521]
MPASFQERFAQPGHDYVTRVQTFAFQWLKQALQPEPDFYDYNTVIRGGENKQALQNVEQRHKIYDRNLLDSLKCAEVRSVRDADWLEGMRRESMKNCYKGVNNPRKKREAEDDTRDERKKRSIDVAGMSIEGQWRAKVAEESGGDNAMDIDILSDGLTSMELETANAEDRGSWEGFAPIEVRESG